MNAQTVEVPLNLNVGVFRHADGRSAVLLQNNDYAHTAWLTIQPALAELIEVDRETGREIPVYDESPEMPGVQVSLDAGDGRLFLGRAN